MRTSVVVLSEPLIDDDLGLLVLLRRYLSWHLL